MHENARDDSVESRRGPFGYSRKPAPGPTCQRARGFGGAWAGLFNCSALFGSGLGRYPGFKEGETKIYPK